VGVAFDLAAFVARYPEFTATVNSTNGPLLFNEATLYCDNSDTSPVIDLTVRAMLLNMLTAHIAQMGVGSSLQPASPLTGRISQAAEGSVSVTTEMQQLPGSAAWYAQTKYGLAFWQASLPYRSGMYVPGCPRDEDPYGSLIFR
jgi:hypothetical protein